MTERCAEQNKPREEFEGKAVEDMFDVDKVATGAYSFPTVRILWDCWQAAQADMQSEIESIRFEQHQNQLDLLDKIGELEAAYRVMDGARSVLKTENERLEATNLELTAQVELMREAFELVSAELEVGSIGVAKSLCFKYNTILSLPPSEAIAEYRKKIAARFDKYPHNEQLYKNDIVEMILEEKP